MTRTLARSTLVLVALAALLLAACGGGDDAAPTDSDTVAVDDGSAAAGDSSPSDSVANQDADDDSSRAPHDTVVPLDGDGSDGDGADTADGQDAVTSSAIALVETAAARTADSEAYQFAMEFGMDGVPDFAGTMNFGAEGAFDPANSRMYMQLDMNSLFDAAPAGTSEEELALMRALLGDGLVEFVIDGDTVYLSWSLFSALFGAETKWVSFTEEGTSEELLGAGLSGVDLDTLGSGPDALFGLVPGLTSLEESGTDIIRGVPATRFVGEIDLAEAIAATSDPADRAELEAAYADLGVGAYGSVPLEIWVDDDGYVRKFTMTFDFAEFGTALDAGAARMWITAEFFGFGEAVSIPIPSPDEVTIIDEESLFGGGFDVDPGTSDGGADPYTADSLAFLELGLGACFDDSAWLFLDSDPTDVETVPCADPHANEVYALSTFPGGPDAPFPGYDVLYSDSLDECIALFEDYVGIDYWESDLIVDVFTPTEASWTQLGNRESVCYLYDIFLEPLEGSMQGSMR